MEMIFTIVDDRGSVTVFDTSKRRVVRAARKFKQTVHEGFGGFYFFLPRRDQWRVIRTHYGVTKLTLG